jgi:hypothetical protein
LLVADDWRAVVGGSLAEDEAEGITARGDYRPFAAAIEKLATT